MSPRRPLCRILLAVTGAAFFTSTGAHVASATEPCGDFGECKALVEINASDGDIGFHFLMDGDDLNSARIDDPNGTKVFEDAAKGPLREQKLTETFAESAEPVCREALKEDEDDVVVTLEEFLDRWAAGTYTFTGSSDGGEKSEGETTLSYDLPAAPEDVDFDVTTGEISWTAGEDLGECATSEELDDLVDDGVLPTHPEEVEVVSWEAVFEPDVDGGIKYSVRVPADGLNPLVVTVPQDFLDALPDDTPAKVEVGAIGADDNATFSEEDGFCINEDEGCEEEE